MSIEHYRTRQLPFEVCRWVFLILLSFGAASAAGGSSIQVTPTAAMEGGFGLQVSLDALDPTPAWIAVGPEKGIQSETAVQARFLIDPSQVSMEKLRERQYPGRPRMCFFSLAQELGSNGTRVTLCLERSGNGAWVISARLWDDTSQGFISTNWARLTGGAPLRREDPVVESLPALIEVEWGAASQSGARDGYFRLSRIIQGEKHPLLERERLDSGTQTINYLQVGVVSQAAQGVSGELYLDAIEISRAPAAPPP